MKYLSQLGLDMITHYKKVRIRIYRSFVVGSLK